MAPNVRPSEMIKEAKGTFDIVSYLYRHQESCLTELIDNVDISQNTVYRAVDILLSLDLISEERRTTFPKRKVYSLTSKGRLLAEAPLYRWDGILDGFRCPAFKKDRQRDHVRE